MLPKYRAGAGGAALLVVLHVAWLPLFAAVHETRHAISSEEAALVDPIAPCPDGEPASHHGHFDRERGAITGLNCDLCAFFQHATGKKGRLDSAAVQQTVPAIAAAPRLPDHPQVFLPIDRPRGRSPPHFV